MYADEKRTYRRVVGGIAWPGTLPGFAVVVGEEILPAVGSKDHHLYVLAEVEEPDVYTLFKRSAEIAVRYHASCFYGRYDLAMINSLNLWNRNALKKGTAVFNFDRALLSEEGKINYHLNVTKNLLLPERKLLHLSDMIESPKLPAHVQSLPPSVATDQDCPHVAALGYAVTLLVEFRLDDYEEEDYEEKERYVDNIDPITGY